MQDLLFQKLQELGIEYTTYTHEPVYTVEHGCIYVAYYVGFFIFKKLS